MCQQVGPASAKGHDTDRLRRATSITWHAAERLRGNLLRLALYHASAGPHPRIFFFSGLCSFLYANSLAKVRDAVPLIDYDTPL